MSLALRRRQAEFIDTVQAHAFTSEFIPRLVDGAIRATGALGGSLWRVDRRSVIDDVDYSTFSFDQGTMEDYRREYALRNPVLPRAMAVMRPGDVACGSDFIDLKAYQRTAFYTEWVRPQGYLHELGGLLEARADFSAMLFVARAPGQRQFGKSERELLRVVIPHVRTALALSRRLQAGQQGELARSALAQRGWIALRRDAGVMLMEGPLVDRLRAAGALFVAEGKLAWAHPVVQREYERILARVVAGAAAGPCTLGLEACGLAIECELVPVAESRLVGLVGAVAVLLFRESGNEKDELNARLARRFELTLQESIVAWQLVDGVDTRVIASNLGIAYETVCTHAKHVYAKAGVKSRAAFSALVQSLRER